MKNKRKTKIMPYYDYQCEKCENMQEEFHSMKDSPKIVCKKCGSNKTKKVISVSQINMGNHPGSSLDEVQ